MEQNCENCMNGPAYKCIDDFCIKHPKRIDPNFWEPKKEVDEIPQFEGTREALGGLSLYTK